MTRPYTRTLWSPEEENYVYEQLPRHGHHKVAKALGRTPAAVHSWASKRGIYHGDVNDYTRIAHLARRAGVPYHHVYQRANADGIIRRLGSKYDHPRSRPALVPDKWAVAFLTEMEAKQEGDELLEEAGWLTVADLQRAWRVGRGTILRGLNGTGVIARLLEEENVRTRQASGYHRTGRWIVEPYGAERVRHRLESDRVRARQLVSTKSLAVEAGVKQGYAATIGREEFGGELLFVNGRLVCHVTPEMAAVMCARFRDGITPGRRKGRPPGSKNREQP